MVRITPEVVKILVGGLITITVSVIVYFITDYKRLADLEEAHIKQALVEKKTEELKELTVKLDSILTLERAERKIYKESVKITIDSLLKNKSIDSRLTEEILENTLSNPNPIPKKDRDEIYKELEVFKITP